MQNEICPDCGQDVPVTLIDGELVYDIHSVQGEEGQCRGSGRSIQASVEE